MDTEYTCFESCGIIETSEEWMIWSSVTDSLSNVGNDDDICWF